jgi:hypothetical protein
VILLVEGAHDEIVIEGLIGDELRRSRTLVLPMRGGRNLATVVDANVLARFSDAPVIAALDNLDAAEINGFWHELECCRDEGQAGFERIVKARFTGKRRSEEVFVIDFCRAVAEAGALTRFRVFPFSKPDIPEYLPVEHLVPGARSWEELREEFEGQKEVPTFKPWLQLRHGVEISDDLLRDAIAQLDSVPDDFVALARMCDETARGRRSPAERTRIASDGT